jgi:DNA polymerase III delta prime subunit
MELTLDNSLIHTDLCKKFKNIEIDELINYYFIGPKSCGKRTFISIFISNLIKKCYKNRDIPNLKTSINTYQVKANNNTIDIEYRSSNFHYELNIYEYGLYDKIVLSEFVKMIGETKSISILPFKILVLYGFDKTNKLAQLSLRRMIEAYSSNIRIFLVGSSYSKIDRAILSRFKTIYLGFPNENELSNLIWSINNEANSKEIILKGNNDLNRIIFLTKLSKNNIEIKLFNTPTSEIINIRLMYFIENEKYTKIGEVREFLLNIVLLNIDLSEVLKNFSKYLIQKLNSEKIPEIIEVLSETDRIANIITWNIFCVEYFLLKIKSILNLGDP